MVRRPPALAQAAAPEVVEKGVSAPSKEARSEEKPRRNDNCTSGAGSVFEGAKSGMNARGFKSNVECSVLNVE
jgi:hypothetical protein